MQFSTTGTGTISVLFPHPRYTASQEIPFRHIPSPHAQAEWGNHTHAHTLTYAWWYGLGLESSEDSHVEGLVQRWSMQKVMKALTSWVTTSVTSSETSSVATMFSFYKFIIQWNYWEVGELQHRGLVCGSSQLALPHFLFASLPRERAAFSSTSFTAVTCLTSGPMNWSHPMLAETVTKVSPYPQSCLLGYVVTAIKKPHTMNNAYTY